MLALPWDLVSLNYNIQLMLLLYFIIFLCWLKFGLKVWQHWPETHSICTVLKVYLHKIFGFCFFPIKAPAWLHDSYHEFISKIKSNSPRYLNYLSLMLIQILWS